MLSKELVHPAMPSDLIVPRLTCEKELSLAFGSCLCQADERYAREHLHFGARFTWQLGSHPCYL